jgi:hypothetical protein
MILATNQNSNDDDYYYYKLGTAQKPKLKKIKVADNAVVLNRR